MEITFNELPKAVTEIRADINEVKRLLLQIFTPPQSDPDRWFDLTELCNYLPDKPVKPTVYGWVHNSLVPCHKKGKKLFFLKSEIDTWLKEGRRKTLAETANEADNYLKGKKGKL